MKTKTIISILLLIVSSITANAQEQSEWKHYKTYHDLSGKKWIKIEYQTLFSSDYSYAKWKVTNLSPYTFSRVGLANKAYNLNDKTQKVKSGESYSRMEPFLKTGEDYIFSRDIVADKGRKIVSAQLLYGAFVIEFPHPETKKTIKLTANNFDSDSILINCNGYGKPLKLMKLNVEYINGTIMRLKEEGKKGTTKVSTFTISNKILTKEGKRYREFKDQIIAEAKYFCGNKDDYSSWFSDVVDFVETQIDKNEIQKQQQCIKDNPETYETKCKLYCMTKFCISGGKSSSYITGVRG